MREFSPEWGKIKEAIQRIFHNGGLKLISLGIAIVLWFFVTNYQDPETILTFNNVPVKLLHTERVTAEGKMFIVLDESDTIPVVTITAPRSVVDALAADNVVATADLIDMTEDNKVPIAVNTNKYGGQIKSIEGSIKHVLLSIEDKKMGTFQIETAINGKVASGNQLGQITMEQNQVRVTGPASYVDRIKSAGVVVDVSGADSSISTNAEIHLYAGDGRDMDLDDLLTLNIDKTMVKVEVLAVKTIPVKIAVSGTPAEGYRLTGETSVEPGRIKVAGKKSVLDNVSSVSIPSSDLNVSGRNKNFVRNIKISKYLSSGVTLADGEEDNVKVTVEIVPMEDEKE